MECYTLTELEANINDLIIKIDDYLVSGSDGLFNSYDRELMVDALVFYKEMQVTI